MMDSKRILVTIVSSLGGFVLCGGITSLFVMMDSTGTHIFYDFWHSNPVSGYVPVFGGLVGAVILAALGLRATRHDG